MKTTTWLLMLAIAMGQQQSGHAQIFVGPNGVAPISFNSSSVLPASEWASFEAGLGVNSSSYFTIGDIAAAVQTLNQGSITDGLQRINVNFIAGTARHNLAGGYLITHASDFGVVLLKATLRNKSFQPIREITVNYNFGVAVPSSTESAPGQRVFFSTNGLPNTWQPIPQFSGLNAPAFVSATLSLGSWLPDTDIFLLWADDNGHENPDGGYTIDNFSISNVVSAPQISPASLPDLRLSKGGVVNAMVVQTDGQIVIGGSFTSVNDVPLSNLARINLAGAVDAVWTPNPDGPVLALATSDTNVFVGGRFVYIAGQFRNGLARLQTSGIGTADGNFAPIPSALSGSPTISALALSGNNLFAGGRFDNLGPSNIANLAKITIAGAVDASWNPSPNAAVHTILVSAPNLYVGGEFTQLGGFIRNRLAKLNGGGTGIVDSIWNPNVDSFAPSPSTNSRVSTLLLNGSDIFLGGLFSQVSGTARIDIAKVSATGSGGLDASWNPQPAFSATDAGRLSLAADGTNLYVGGRFIQIGGRSLTNLARLSMTGTGAAQTNWAPKVNGPVNALLKSGTWLFLGGSFTLVNDTISLGLAKLDLGSPIVDEAFSAQVGAPGAAHAIARQSDGKIIIGGDFWLAGSELRPHLARINTDGTLDAAWAPATDGTVNAVVVDGTNVFVGGTFDFIKGQRRNRLAKVNTVTDVVDVPWNPSTSASAIVYALAADSGNLYVGGTNLGINGVGSLSLARVSTTGTGAADLNWSTTANGPVRALTIRQTNLFVGGEFTSIRSSNRNGVAKFLTTGSGTIDASWIVNVSSPSVHALAADQTHLFIGGAFSTVNGVGRTCLAKVSASSGALDDSWMPGALPSPVLDIYALGIFTNLLYVEGSFGPNQAGLARLLPNGAVDTDWRPSAFGSGSSTILLGALLPSGQDLYVGGPFQSVGGFRRYGFAFLPQLDAPIMVKSTATNFVIFPSPADGLEVTYFRIVDFTGGSLFSGVISIQPGDFVTVAQGAAGLRFVGSTGTVMAVCAVGDTPGGAVSPSTTLSLGAAAAALFSFSSPTYAVTENGTTVTVSVRKVGPPNVGVSYSSADQTAINGIHYFGGSGSLFFSNESSKTISFPIFDNALVDGDKAFAINLFNPSAGASIGYPATATITIEEDESIFSIASFTTNRLPTALSPATGLLSVNLQPPAANGRWRLAGQAAWQGSGAFVSNLVSGIYSIEFLPVGGYRTPDAMIGVVSSGGALFLTNTYVLAETNFGGGLGYLTLLIAPDFVANDPIIAQRGQWRVVNTVTWLNSGDVFGNLSPGTYNVEFKNIGAYVTPAPEPLVVFANEGTRITGDYCRESEASGSAPTAVNFVQATTTRPYLYAGQLRTELGFGSGVVVRDNTVLTSAHLLFDDSALSYVSSARWFFQRYAGRYEPPAQVPRGWQVMSGYAAQRRLENTPANQGLASLNMDVAAVYSFESTARGGVGGYLVSDSVTNWLATSRLKMLVGYPMEGVTISNQGVLHATVASNLTFFPASSNVFGTTQIRGFPALAGAPLNVLADDGNYYPAAIYLGPCAASNMSSMVRILDKGVAELISRADLSGSARLSIPLLKGSFGSLGTLTTNLLQIIGGGIRSSAILEVRTGPLEALKAGGGWRIGSAPNLHTNEVEGITVREKNTFITFQCIKGFALPVRQAIDLADGATYVITQKYLLPPTSPNLTVRRLPLENQEVALTVSNGLPGYTFDIESIPVLGKTDGWTTVHTVQFKDGKPIILRDTNPRLPNVNRFYRARWNTCTNL